MLRVLTCLALVSFSGASSSAADEDWPRWRGPRADGISHETGWAVSNEMQPAWKAEVGLGYSSVAIADGRLFTMGYDRDAEKDIVRCLDAVTGEEKWSYSYAAEIWDKGHDGGTLSTPVIDDGRVYTKNREGKLYCFDAATGEVHWSKDLMDAYDAGTGLWGFSSTPLVQGDLLIVDVGIACAFDKKTGELAWRSKDYGQAYATPVALTRGDKSLVGFFNKTGLVILNRNDGMEIAVHEWPTFNDINAASPVVIDQERVFISSGARHGCAMLNFDGKGLDVAWENKVLKTAMNAAVLYEGHLYGFDDQVLKCIDLSGEEVWAERGIGLGAMMVANGNLLIMSGDGELIVAKASPGGFEEASRTPVLEGGKFWTVPVITGGRVYCRNSLGTLVCLDCSTRG